MYFNMLATTVSISRKIFKFNIFSRYLIITQCAVLLSVSWLLLQLLRLRASDQNKLLVKTDVDPTKLGEVYIINVVSG